MERSGVLLTVVLLACLVASFVVAPAMGVVAPPAAACQKYDLHMYGGQFGLEKYPYNRVVASARNMQGVRATVTLYDKHNKEDGVIFFVNDQYLQQANIAEYKALSGKTQVSAQPYSQFASVLSLLRNCEGYLTVKYTAECQDSLSGTTVVTFA